MAQGNGRGPDGDNGRSNRDAGAGNCLADREPGNAGDVRYDGACRGGAARESRRRRIRTNLEGAEAADHDVAGGGCGAAGELNGAAAHVEDGAGVEAADV